MERNIIVVPPEWTKEGLTLAGPHLLRGLSTEDGFTLEDAVEGIIAGTHQLWLVFNGPDIEGAFLTTIVAEDTGKVLDVGALAGSNITAWGKTISRVMTEFARYVGAGRIIFKGRKGLLRAYEGFNIVGEDSPGIFKFERAVT